VVILFVAPLFSVLGSVHHAAQVTDGVVKGRCAAFSARFIVEMKLVARVARIGKHEGDPTHIVYFALDETQFA
jgi:hypothetical protein